jgi:hypothetical protein
MGKGNFFKKDIKKKKKERKDRGIKQRILDQKKKVGEKIHHVVDAVAEIKKSTETEPVVEQTVKEPEPVVEQTVKEPEPVVEQTVKEPEPVVEQTVKEPEPKIQHLIFDSSIISYIMLDNSQVIEGIQRFSEDETKFLTFDAVINSFIENEQLTYNRILTFDQIVSKLKKIGNFQYYGFDENSELGQRANALFKAEKYVDNSDILEEEKLSKTDCILIELLIDKSVILVTNNSLLKEATIQEAKERNVTVNIFDPLEL